MNKQTIWKIAFEASHPGVSPGSADINPARIQMVVDGIEAALRVALTEPPSYLMLTAGQHGEVRYASKQNEDAWTAMAAQKLKECLS